MANIVCGVVKSSLRASDTHCLTNESCMSREYCPKGNYLDSDGFCRDPKYRRDPKTHSGVSAGDRSDLSFNFGKGGNKQSGKHNTPSGIVSGNDNIYRFNKTVTDPNGTKYAVQTDYQGNIQPNGNAYYDRGR